MGNSRYDKLDVGTKVKCDRCGKDSIELRHVDIDGKPWLDSILCCSCIEKYKPLDKKE